MWFHLGVSGWSLGEHILLLVKANQREGKPDSSKCCGLFLELKPLVRQVRYSGVAGCFCFRPHALLGCYLGVTKSLSFTVNAAQLSRSLKIWQNGRATGLSRVRAGREGWRRCEKADMGCECRKGHKKKAEWCPRHLSLAWSHGMGEGPPGWTSLDHPVTEAC